MRILIDILHPAHVHFFKNAYWEWKKRGYEVLVTAREKEISLFLLDKYKIPYIKISDFGQGLFNLGWELLSRNIRLFRLAVKFKPDVLVSIGGTSIAQVGAVIRCPSLVFTDTEHAKLSNAITFPWATRICTPTCFRRDLEKKHLRYNGYQELAYLHPNYFQPQPQILEDLGIKVEEPYVLIRFVSWEAAHDIGESGVDIELRAEMVRKLEDRCRVFISSEDVLPPELERYQLRVPPEVIHQVLCFARLYLGESPTMATESAVLGTPAVLVSSWAGEAGNMKELENKYGLMFCFKDTEPAFEKALQLLGQPNLKEKWYKLSRKVWEEKLDVTEWLVKQVEEYGVETDF